MDKLMWLTGRSDVRNRLEITSRWLLQLLGPTSRTRPDFWVPLVVLDQCVAPETKSEDTGRVRPVGPRDGLQRERHWSSPTSGTQRQPSDQEHISCLIPKAKPEPPGRNRRTRAPLSVRLCAWIWLLPLAFAAGCSSSEAGGANRAETNTLTIGAYSVVREALREGLLPAFAEHWKQTTGRSVRFEESYNASGAQARAIAAGFDADVAVLSLEDDIDLLVKAGIVSKDWRKSGPGGGMITRSLVVIGVRPGNPKQVTGWDDLTRPGVAVLYPDPKTSGGARWNINAIYGAGWLGLKEGTPPDASAARDLLAKVQKNVVNMDSSGRQSLATFERGVGDAVVTYENELNLRLKRSGGSIESILPSRTLLIEGPAALVETSVNRHGNRALAEAFLKFAQGAEGQRILGEYGFRRLDAPIPAGVFTMKDLGGWTEIKAKLYGPKGVWNALFTDRRK